MAQRPILDEATLQQIMCTLVERFGEPIGHAADAGQGVADERGGHPHKGPKMGNRGFGAKEVQGTSAELDEETAASKRRRIMLKSPVQKQVDPRPRCEDCGRLLTRQDYTSYWDDDFPPRDFGDPTPRICLDCVEKPRINEDVSPAEVNSPVCAQCGGMMGIGLDEETCTQCGMMGGMNEVTGSDPQGDFVIEFRNTDTEGKAFSTYWDAEVKGFYGKRYATRYKQQSTAERVLRVLQQSGRAEESTSVVPTSMVESQGGGRHPGHASSCTCPDCSRPEAEDESTSYLDEDDLC